MARQKERSEVEWLKAEVRRLTSENRSLRKALGRANKEARKASYSTHDEDPEESVEEVVRERTNSCPKCHREINEVDLGTRTLYRCSGCKYRTSKLKE